MTPSMDVPRLSAVEREILDLLIANGKMYGLEMVKKSERLKRGTIYVTLRRMGDKGYVTSREEKEPDQPGLPRRLFEVTGYGERVYNAYAQLHQALRFAPSPLGG